MLVKNPTALWRGQHNDGRCKQIPIVHANAKRGYSSLSTSAVDQADDDPSEVELGGGGDMDFEPAAAAEEEDIDIDPALFGPDAAAAADSDEEPDESSQHTDGNSLEVVASVFPRVAHCTRTLGYGEEKIDPAFLSAHQVFFISLLLLLVRFSAIHCCRCAILRCL
jgi:hypothetical protein